MASDSDKPVELVAVDRMMLRTLELEGLICFRCPLLDRRPGGAFDTGECRLKARDLLPVVSDERSGILAAVSNRQVVGYAVFGRPELFPRLKQLPFEAADDALLIAALYAVPKARERNVEADLLVRVMDFARENGFEKVQALCRAEPDNEPEARAELLSDAGFELTGEAAGLCMAETTLERWDQPEHEDSDEHQPGTAPDWTQSN